MSLRAALLVVLSATLGPWVPAQAQTNADHGTLVIVVGQEGSLPIPTILGGRAHTDVADQLFLRLADIGPQLRTGDESTYEPRLAARWQRRDSLTIVFDLDPRARWHDGTPVTARDVVFTFDRYRDPAISAQYALILRWLASVTAEGDHRVVFRFSRRYAEQFYDAVFHVQPLPAHLVDTIPHDRLASSAFARAPVGNGPYRWVRREPGQRIELAADPRFFLGAPKIDRLIFLTARDPEAQLNLLLDGTADAHQGIDPVVGLPRLRPRNQFTVRPVASLAVGYMLFNLRARGDRSRPHPILADVEVRRALAMAIDTRTLVRVAMGNFGSVPDGPNAQPHWIRAATPRTLPFDPGRARRLLGSRGWRDTDGDGILDKNGVPLVLTMNYPAPSAVRSTMSPMVQDQFRRVGVRLDLVRLDGPVWIERRNSGDFDIDFSQGTTDPTPSSLIQVWSCAATAGANVGHFCDPPVDSLLDRAISSTAPDLTLWRQITDRLVDQAPAVFVYAPTNAMVVHKRFTNVSVSPTSYWANVWRWAVRPGQQLPRDRRTGSE